MVIIDKLLTPEEVAEILQVTPKTIRQYITKGMLTAAKLGNVWRIDESDLKIFIEQQKSNRKA